MPKSFKWLAALTLGMALAAPAADALPVRGIFSGTIASERNPDFTTRYSAGDDWSLSFQFQDDRAPAFVGSNFADYALSGFNFVSLRLNGFTTRPVSNGFAMRVRENSLAFFGNLNRATFPSPFDRAADYDFFVQVDGPGIAGNFADLSTINTSAIESATPFPLLRVDGDGFGVFGGSTQAILTLNEISLQRILPPPPPPPPMSAVPVPAAGVLFASLWGMIAVWGARRRKVV